MHDLPAMLGGVAVRPGGPPAWPLPNPDVHAAIEAAATSGAWGQYHGEHVAGLEAELAEFHEVAHAITCASGTLAVEAALRALKVAAGDEVVMAAYDYESNFLTLHALGAKPVLVDVHPTNWQLDPARLDAAISPQTKAILCSHLHGGLVPMREVVAIARARGIGVVEDAAQAPGAIVDGKPAGTWGDVGTLSFGGSKLLSAGRGGALLFREAQLFQRAKTWLHRGIQQWAPLSELQAAVLRPQLRMLPEATARRAERVRALMSALNNAACPLSPLLGRMTPEHLPRALSGDAAAKRDSSSSPAFYKLGFQYDPASFGLARDLFVKAMRAEGIAFDLGFRALHIGRSPSRFRASGELIHAADAHARCVVLHHPVLSGTVTDIEQVAEATAKVYRYRDRF